MKNWKAGINNLITKVTRMKILQYLFLSLVVCATVNQLYGADPKDVKTSAASVAAAASAAASSSVAVASSSFSSAGASSSAQVAVQQAAQQESSGAKRVKIVQDLLNKAVEENKKSNSGQLTPRTSEALMRFSQDLFGKHFLSVLESQGAPEEIIGSFRSMSAFAQGEQGSGDYRVAAQYLVKIGQSISGQPQTESHDAPPANK
jgi:hypothetical protein